VTELVKGDVQRVACTVAKIGGGDGVVEADP